MLVIVTSVASSHCAVFGVELIVIDLLIMEQAHLYYYISFRRGPYHQNEELMYLATLQEYEMPGDMKVLQSRLEEEFL